jgi:hypothetical protein
MSEAALEYVEREHDLERVAELYVAALEEAAGGDAVADAVVDEVARAAAESRDRAGHAVLTRARGPTDEVGLARNAAPEPARRGAARAHRSRARAAVGVARRARRRVVRGLPLRLARRVVAPWIMVDELIYSELAKSFAATGHFLVRGVHHGATAFVYPAADRAGVALFGVGADAYAAAKAINSRRDVARRVPAYFLARRVLAPLPRCSRRRSRSRSRRWSTPAR